MLLTLCNKWCVVGKNSLVISFCYKRIKMSKYASAQGPGSNVLLNSSVGVNVGKLYDNTDFLR